MRQKTLPRHRMISHTRDPAEVSQNHGGDSISFTQDVSKQFIDVEGYAEAREIREESGTTIVQRDKNARVNDAGEIVAEKNIHCTFNAEGRTEENFGAINLSLKDGFGTFTEKQTPNSDDKFAGSLLYQIMTDPKFVENIRHDKEVKKLTCKFCKKQLSTDEELQGHQNSRVNDLNQITCCACGKIFGQKRYLRYHQRYHLEKNKFTCGFCPKKYSRMDNLARHRTFHTNPNKYSCNICKKSFSRRDLMTKHAKSHEKKEINCNLCKKDFTDFAKMKTHMLTSHAKNKLK